MSTRAQVWQGLLAPYRWSRRGRNPLRMDPVRNPFLQDHDRIIFSSSFRRLAKKTQVHPLVRNDHIHNRLTHSLEVSCVGRSLGATAGFMLRERGHLPPDYTPDHVGQIVQAACLAHDIGNPPFGHAGEDAIRDWFGEALKDKTLFAGLTEEQGADFAAFDGNAQGFRVVNSLENNKDVGGLRLSYPVIASLVKYPCSAAAALNAGKKKFNYYTAEKEIFEDVFSGLGLMRQGVASRHPLSYLLEAADDICYRIVDMEDALELRIIAFDDIKAAMAPLFPAGELEDERLRRMDSDRRRSGMLRTMAMGKIIPAVAGLFRERYEDILAGELPGGLLDHARGPVAQFMAAARGVFIEKIMNDPQKTTLEIGSYTLYKRLLDVFVPACRHHCGQGENPGKAMTYQESRALALMGVNAPAQGDDLYTSYLRVVDFVSGMTDHYATFISRQFSGTAAR